MITRRNGLNSVLKSIDAALALSFESVKINFVPIRNVNDDEILDFVDLTKEKNPFAVDGQNGHHIINCDKYTERTCSGFPLFTHQWALLMILVSILTSLWCT